MTPDHTKDVFRLMRGLAEARRGSLGPLEPTRHGAPRYDNGEILQHVAFLCDEGQRLVDIGKIEKAMRWLGWIQGVAYSLGWATLDELKRANMPPAETTDDGRGPTTHDAAWTKITSEASSWPESGREVLVTADGDVGVAFIRIGEDFFRDVGGNRIVPVAWMPMPAPYQEKKASC